MHANVHRLSPSYAATKPEQPAVRLVINLTKTDVDAALESNGVTLLPDLMIAMLRDLLTRSDSTPDVDDQAAA